MNNATKNESVIEEISRKLRAISAQPLIVKRLMVAEPGKPSNELALLGAAEESYSQAALVLQPALGELQEFLANVISWDHEGDLASRLTTGLHLLEGAMAAHNRYVKSL